MTKSPNRLGMLDGSMTELAAALPFPALPCIIPRTQRGPDRRPKARAPPGACRFQASFSLETRTVPVDRPAECSAPPCSDHTFHLNAAGRSRLASMLHLCCRAADPAASKAARVLEFEVMAATP